MKVIIKKIGIINLFLFICWFKHLFLTELGQKITLRKKGSDRLVFFQIFIEEEYKNAPGDSDFIIDLGANNGLSCLYFRKHNPKAQIIAVEPDYINFDLLSQNTSESNIVCINKWAWFESTFFSLNEEKAWTWWSQVSVSGEETKLNSITIWEIMSTYNFPHIDILKIDIEGAEKHLFSKNYSSWLQKTRCIAIELHDTIEPGASHTFLSAIYEIWGVPTTISVRSDVIMLYNGNYKPPTAV